MRRILLLSLTLLFSTVSWAQISLAEYRDSVYKYSNSIKDAVFVVEQSREQMKMAKTDFLPEVSASGSFTTLFRRPEGGDLWNFTLGPRIEQLIYGGGGVRNAYKQADNNYRAALWGEAAAILDMRYEADYAYWLLSAMKLYVAATEEYVGIIKSLYGVVRERFQEGYVAKGDLLQVETRLSDAEYSLLAIKNNYDVALHRFNNLSGREEGLDVELQNSIIDSIPMPRRIGLEEMFDRRPDVNFAELDIVSAKYGVKIARAAYNPQIGVEVGGSWQTYSPNNGGRTYLDGAMVLSLNVPIFHWGERKRAVAMARAEVGRMENRLEEVGGDAAQFEADDWSRLSSSYAQMQSSLHNLEIAGENLSISTYSYSEGKATVLDVLQAQISWIQIYTNAITARFDYAVGVSAYMRTTAAD